MLTGERRIPYHRALHLANQAGIAEQLYPLFVHDIAALVENQDEQVQQSIDNPAGAAQIACQIPDIAAASPTRVAEILAANAMADSCASGPSV